MNLTKYDMNRISISLITFLLTMVCCTTQGKDDKKAGTTEAVETSTEAEIAEPTKTMKESYPWKLSQCAQKDSHINVVLSKDDEGQQKAVIYIDGKQTQAFAGEEELFTDWYDQPAETMIHFVDANFDGHTDIFLGPGESRTYSTILLWNPERNKFERIGKLGEPSLQNPVFSPHEAAIYLSGSNSAWEYSFSKMEWKGNELVETDNLFYYSIPQEQTKITGKKCSMFEKKDKNGKTIKAYKSKKELPKYWRQIVDITLE